MRRMLLPNKHPLNYIIVTFALYHLVLNTLGTISESVDSNNWNTLLVWVGSPILIAFSLNEFFRKPVAVPRESKQIIVFLLFVLLGFFYAFDESYFLVQYRKLFLYFAIFLVVQFTVAQTGNLNIIFVSILLASAYISVVSLFFVSDFYGGGFSVDEGFRVTGGYINPNGLSNYAISGLISVLFLFRNLPRPYSILVAWFAPLFLLTVIAAASKTGLISLVTMLGLWYIFCLRSATGRNSAVGFVTLVIGLIVFNFLIDFIADKTYLGQRFTQLSDLDEYYEKDGRGRLAARAIDVFVQNPVMGVGLGQFRFYNPRKAYTHSEYLEILCSFGVLGALIYFPVYFFIWRRLRLLSSLPRARDTTTDYNINFMKMLLLTMVFRGISVIIIYAFDELIFIGITGAYSFYMLNKLKQEYNDAETA